MEYPICFILQHRKHGTFVPNSNISYAVSDRILVQYENNPDAYTLFFSRNIKLAKLWSDTKKIKRHLTKDTAKHFDVVSSDHKIFPAEDLFKP